MSFNIAFGALLGAASIGTAPAADLTPAAATEVTEQIARGLDSYVHPAAAKKAQARLRARKAEYAKLGSREAYAQAVSADLFEITRDKHLKVSVQSLQAERGARVTDEEQALIDARLAYGLSAVRRLPGNIGYLKLSYFEQGQAGCDVVDGVLRLLKDTDALILDLRGNRGGGGCADERLLGHLSPADKAIPMARITWRRADGSTEIMQRRPSKPEAGPLYADKPVYVLTGERTFSAAEAVAYDLKVAGRATLVGETTAGGANPSDRPVPLSYGFRVFVPNGLVSHPLTGANWEGVGVKPHVEVVAENALVEAYGRALTAAKPQVATPRSELERTAATHDPYRTLVAELL
jgi:C-terminal processing protease CtpA/Prc